MPRRTGPRSSTMCAGIRASTSRSSTGRRKLISPRQAAPRSRTRPPKAFFCSTSAAVSSEIVWLTRASRGGSALRERIRFWASLKLGVVTLAEKFGGLDVSAETFEAMTAYVAHELRPFADDVRGADRCGRFHLLGTSGTVTTIAGVYLGLVRYDRRRVDGLWMTSAEVDAAIGQLRAMSYRQRAANGCIGPERADLVLAGCAILEAIRRAFPADRVRIADRGLREGILMQLMHADGQGAPAS